ncbi:MAG TPA: RtcB family protein, partial [Holophaga sp.]|nr:RtcB family protein [Holophaga sp.]
PDLPILRQELDSARHQLGTLGGGNHFIEFLADGKGCLWVMLHSGSRNFGFRAAHAYHQQARALCDRRRIELPDRDLAYLPMDEQSGQDYLAAMTYCLAFARANRARMMSVILEILHRETGATPVQELDIHHNYAALERHYGREVWVHRKGATRARAGETGIVPGSMGSPSYLVEGLGNPESFQSCAHGAGRRMGRKEAGRKLVLAEEQAKLAGILHGLRSRSDLDEAPSAYKDIDAVMENQRDLVRITTRLKPLASIKG